MIFNYKPTKDAKTLEGHGAEYFAPLSLLVAQKMPVGTDLNDCREVGTYYFDSYASNYVNVPSDTAHNGIMVVRKQSSIRLVQEYVAINTGVMYIRTAGNSSTWNEWKTVASTADLANYLPLTGGVVKGDFIISADEVVNRYQYLKNPARTLYHVVQTNGNYAFYDNTNGKAIITSIVDGTNTFNGTATGNLLINGGGTVNSQNRQVITVNSEIDGNGASTIRFNLAGAVLGELGISNTNGAFYREGTTNHKLHHDGNSAKVHIGTSAPSDTTALWIDTSA